GEPLRGVREVTDVVEHRVGRRQSIGPSDAAAVDGDGDTVLVATTEERVVVVGAVEREEVDVRVLRRRRAPHRAAREDGAEAQGHRIVERVDRVVRIALRYQRNGDQTVGVWLECVDGHAVGGTGERGAHAVL